MPDTYNITQSPHNTWALRTQAGSECFELQYLYEEDKCNISEYSIHVVENGLCLICESKYGGVGETNCYTSVHNVAWFLGIINSEYFALLTLENFNEKNITFLSVPILLSVEPLTNTPTSAPVPISNSSLTSTDVTATSPSITHDSSSPTESPTLKIEPKKEPGTCDHPLERIAWIAAGAFGTFLLIGWYLNKDKVNCNKFHVRKTLAFDPDPDWQNSEASFSDSDVFARDRALEMVRQPAHSEVLIKFRAERDANIAAGHDSWHTPDAASDLLAYSREDENEVFL
jgi:hypothetical protein